MSEHAFCLYNGRIFKDEMVYIHSRLLNVCKNICLHVDNYFFFSIYEYFFTMYETNHMCDRFYPKLSLFI